MSKVNAIRKKALEHVRKQNWSNAIKEYTRLADLDQSNPNVFNELGDIYLKIGNKNDAYEAFSRAIDSYTRVSLHNNAVAVCKKVLRLIPARYEVLIKLGLIRKKQGLTKEAESYYSSYLDKLLVDQSAKPEHVMTVCGEITDEMKHFLPVLTKAYECMVKFNLKEQTGDLLQALHGAYKSAGDDAGVEETRQRMEELGVEARAAQPTEPTKEGVVITEENIWSAAHTEGERIGVDTADPISQDSPPIGSSTSRANSVYGYGDVDIDSPDGVTRSGDRPASTQTIPDPSEGAPQVATEPGDGAYDVSPLTQPETPANGSPQPQTLEHQPPATPDQAPPIDETESPAPPAGEEWQSQPEGSQSKVGAGGGSGNVHVSAIIGEMDDGGGEMTEDDHRSHYDLGMAYLEMDLMAEAIREFQAASKSEAYQARALEMIGLCFLRQNQPHLAVKQLTKGLQLIGGGDVEALGIKYNLGLAYEMIGDFEQARSAFEDVYVEDVTFREVAEKIAKYT